MTPERFSRPSIAIHAVCAVMLLLFALPVPATTVVALIDRFHHRAVVAADTLLVSKVADTSIQTCKIVAKPSCTFGMAGLFYKEGPVFHLQELAEQACGCREICATRQTGFSTSPKTR
jgi:hypothetical protein